MNPKGIFLAFAIGIVVIYALPLNVPVQPAQVGGGPTGSSLEQNSSTNPPAETFPWEDNQNQSTPTPTPDPFAPILPINNSQPPAEDPSAANSANPNPQPQAQQPKNQPAKQTGTNAGDIENPLGFNNLTDLANHIGDVLLEIATPIAFIIIIWAGIMLITSRGVPETVTQAHKTIWYVVLGYAILLIGKGFVTLIQSIINLKNGTP